MPPIAVVRTWWYVAAAAASAFKSLGQKEGKWLKQSSKNDNS
jgi:hypothetical protein